MYERRIKASQGYMYSFWLQQCPFHVSTGHLIKCIDHEVVNLNIDNIDKFCLPVGVTICAGPFNGFATPDVFIPAF